jgi:hypothetical protein
MYAGIAARGAEASLIQAETRTQVHCGTYIVLACLRTSLLSHLSLPLSLACNVSRSPLREVI